MNFNDLAIIAPILKALAEEGYTTPTPIQEQAIPHVNAGRDLLGCAQTGTGKTAAFSIPTLQRLYTKKQSGDWSNKIKALILTPTRELAIQIDESLAAYGRHVGLRHTVIFGGVGQKPQTDALARGVDILTATPGRLLDLMNQGFVNLKGIEFFVLDEADRMLDMGFIHDVRKVLAVLPNKRQSLFFSATMPPEIVKLADTILTDPVKVEVTPVSSTADTVRQSVYLVERDNKRNLLRHILEDKAIESALVFTRTKHGADKVAEFLNKQGIKTEAIHGNKAQNARQRALSNFKERTTRVLVATDIAARGIDVDNLSHVINFELPNIPESYVHRIGRTGRAGASGIAISFCETDERAYLKDIQKLIGRKVPVEVANNPFPSDNRDPIEVAKPPKPNQREPREPREARNGRANQPRRAEKGPQQQNRPELVRASEQRTQRTDDTQSTRRPDQVRSANGQKPRGEGNAQPAGRNDNRNRSNNNRGQKPAPRDSGSSASEDDRWRPWTSYLSTSPDRFDKKK
ncbi:ATP-dependent RNA helicase RhlE [Fibrella aestuarina BUZ 2]|uniref:DEAD-box ATP-dependent RNA helicase RhpA n=1 Tax=Fibrella aestuarina BUZ 2 TaxID=1166018 RepID=I0K444_9BACT|nr:DEAD/DEAH box helicase [Fibrella aestuarina]CCG98897.1 ATP-dependent RNA helicase RhlE [Fibrella aestuarina BUZ 2]